MSGLFPHRVIDQKEGFVFLVAPSDENDADAVVAAEQAESILREAWASAPSGLTVADVRDPEEAELIYADALQLLQEADLDEAEQIIITGVIVVGELVVVNCILAGEDVPDEDEDEDDDSVEADEEDFD